MKPNAKLGAKQMKRGKKIQSTQLIDRIEECDRTGQVFLDISNLDLPELPRELIILPSIKHLIGYKNSIVDLSSLSNFRALESLDLSRNKMCSLENANISQLYSLRKIDLCRNCLTSLPLEITRLPLLEILILHRNNLSSIPDKMDDLKSMKTLDLSFNNLVEIGSSLESLPVLEELNLCDNPELNVLNMGIRTRRLYDKRVLMSGKTARRALVARALGVQRQVLTREQEHIFRTIHENQKLGKPDMYP